MTVTIAVLIRSSRSLKGKSGSTGNASAGARLAIVHRLGPGDDLAPAASLRADPMG